MKTPLVSLRLHHHRQHNRGVCVTLEKNKQKNDRLWMEVNIEINITLRSGSVKEA